MWEDFLQTQKMILAVLGMHNAMLTLLALGVVDQGPSDVSMWLTVVARGMDLTDFEYGMYVCMYAYFE